MKEPLVSIILPTYNRSRFMPQAFQSIRAQTWQQWELIIVEDGSTDDTQHVVARLSSDLAPRVRYVHQENQGFAGARATGLELARGKYVAFFDSDDCWLPHHLKDCVDSLEACSEVDWVWGASRLIHWQTGRVIAANSFYNHGRPLPFLKLRTRCVGRLRIIDDAATVRCLFLGGFNCGLQNSVVRTPVFAEGRLCFRQRNVAIDQVIIITALKEGVRFGYFDNVHVLYHVHGENASACGEGPLHKHLQVFRDQAWCYETLYYYAALTSAEKRALIYRLSNIYFWQMGYVLLWQNGHGEEALAMFRRGLRLRPWSIWYWKTYLLAWLRIRIGSRFALHNEFRPLNAFAKAALDQRRTTFLGEGLRLLPLLSKKVPGRHENGPLCP